MLTSMSGHTVFVLLHAAAAVVSLVAGLMVLWRGRGLRVHQLGVLAMAVMLVPSMSFGWAAFSTASRVVFCGLFGLAIFMTLQSRWAAVVRNREDRSGSVLSGSRIGPAFVRAIGFNVIALTVAGTVVPALRFGGVLAMVICVVGAGVLAHFLVEWRRARVQARLTEEPGPRMVAHR